MAFKKKKKRGRKKTADPRLEQLKLIGKGVEGIKLMNEVPRFRVVPSVFAGFNRAIGLHGVPLNTVIIVHGPTHGGKTLLVIGTGLITFERAGGLPVYIDAEHAADVRRWFARCGLDLHLSWYRKPRTYEDVIKMVTIMLTNIHKGIETGALRDDIILSIALDSLDKLVPEAEITKVLLDGKIDRNSGRWKAAMNKYFFNLVTPLMTDLPVTLFVIAHESVKMEGKGKSARKMFEVKGGTHVLYDARCQLRVKFIGFDYIDVGGTKIAVRKKHLVRVVKNKVGFPDTEFTFYSATRNGHERGQPWLDLGRELFDEACRYAFVQRGAYYKFGGKSRYMEAWVKLLNAEAPTVQQPDLRGFYGEVWNEVARGQEGEWVGDD